MARRKVEPLFNSKSLVAANVGNVLETCDQLPPLRMKLPTFTEALGSLMLPPTESTNVPVFTGWSIVKLDALDEIT